MKAFRFIFFVSFFCSLTAFAQFDYLNIYGGTVFYPNDEKINASGKSESIFGGYQRGLKIGAGVEKYFTDNLGVGINIDYGISSKPRYDLSQLKLDLNLKYSFFRYNRVSPYVFAGGNISFFSINQDSYVADSAKIAKENDDVLALSQVQQFGKISVLFVPVLGFVGGTGVSIRINEWFSVYVEYAFNYYLNTQSTFPIDYFPGNKTNLTTSTLQAGVKIDLY